MIELTEEEFKGDLDKYTLRIENGEDFLIKKSSGEKQNLENPTNPYGDRKSVV